MQRTIPLLITFVVGLIMVGEFFIPHHAYRAVTTAFLDWGLILIAAAYLLGIINLVQVNLPRVVRLEKDWPYKAVMLIALFGTLILGFVAGEQRQEPGQIYKWIYDSVYTPLAGTMFALLAFFIASAAFRAFRARNLEAGLLLGAAIIVMLFKVPLGQNLPGLGDFMTPIVNWILDVPNTAARRSIYIGAALGAIATGLRIILGIERSHLGD